MHIRYLFSIITLVLTFWFADSAMALQTHGEPEGIYVHQMAHILFIAALAYLSWHTRRTQETSSRGWRYFQIFCIFMICWNALAFTGHITLEHLQESDFLAEDDWQARLAPPITVIKALYYLTKMDHFLLVPALLALVLSLRKFYIEALGEVEK